jgi:hypothetical protein
MYVCAYVGMYVCIMPYLCILCHDVCDTLMSRFSPLAYVCMHHTLPVFLVCMYVRMYVCIIRLHVCMNVCIMRYPYVCILLLIHPPPHTRMYPPLHTRMYVSCVIRMYVYTNVLNVCSCVCMYTPTYVLYVCMNRMYVRMWAYETGRGLAGQAS